MKNNIDCCFMEAFVLIFGDNSLGENVSNYSSEITISRSPQFSKK